MEESYSERSIDEAIQERSVGTLSPTSPTPLVEGTNQFEYLTPLSCISQLEFTLAVLMSLTHVNTIIVKSHIMYILIIHWLSVFLYNVCDSILFFLLLT